MESRTIPADALPLFVCHKKVHAGVIEFVSVPMNAFGDRNLGLKVGDEILVEACPGAMFARYLPTLGDYLVVYDANTKHEYRSISPKSVFEAGYSIAPLSGVKGAAPGVDQAPGAAPAPQGGKP